MKNFKQRGDVITLTAPYTVVSGAGAKVGRIFGVAQGDITSGADGEFLTEGVVDLAKATGLDFAQGDAAYWDDSQKKVVDTDSGNSYLIGVAILAATTSATIVRVRLNNTCLPAS